MILDHGLAGSGEVVVLPPRRIAARMLARRVALERGGSAGGEVGYQVRFERVAGSGTRIRYVTEGILLREMMGDPELRGVGAIVFDEFHERHLYGDITLAKALDLQEGARPDLKLVVMSATLEAAGLREYLGGCPLVEARGRTFPVEVRHAPPRAGLDKGVPEQVARACRDLFASGHQGDVLVFLAGAFEIRKTIEILKARGWTGGRDVFPLYGELPPAQQDAAVAPGGRSKIVVATNVAETSLTIEGVTAVVDSGLARVAAFDPVRGINTLTIEKISRASADQRAGRAGRTAPGVAIRLWSERDHQARPAQESPEVQRLDLAEVVLTLKVADGGDLREFRWFEKPDEASLARAEALLAALGAVDRESGEVTETGRVLARFPLHPRHARVLVEGAAYGCLHEAALCVALTQGRPVFFKRRAGGRGGGGRDAIAGPEAFALKGDRSDFAPQVRAWQFAASKRFAPSACGELGINAGAAREAGSLFRQLLACTRSAGLAQGTSDAHADQGSFPAGTDPEAMGKALLAGFPDHVALRHSAATSACAVVDGRRGRVAEGSVVRDARLLVAAQITEVEGREVTVILSDVTAVEDRWLEELFPGEFQAGEEVEFDPQARRVVARQQRKFRDLVLESRERGEPDPERAAALLAREVVAGNLVLKRWDHSVDQWIARVNCLARWMPELEMPAVGTDDREFLIQQVCLGAKSYREIKDRDPWPALRSWLSAPQRAALESFAPERVTLPNGRTPKVVYAEDGEPKVSLVLQQLYDITRNPTVADGRVTVLVELLGPNHRPVQTTADLGTFWKTSYAEVRKQLAGRYPKHEWR
ncbi:ATP-dependent helicase HrpB [soil metagenome]